jgi:hypothetical protein
MNKMAGRVDALLDQHEHDHARGARPAMLDEMRLWVAVDPLLAELHKQYLDVKAQRVRLTDKHGDSDPICDVAADMEDSARCAVETRLIELRKSEEGKAALQALIRKAHARQEAELVVAEREKTSAYWKDFAAYKGPRAVERGRMSFYKMMFYVIILQQLTEEACLHLRIAQDFTLAANSRRLAASG